MIKGIGIKVGRTYPIKFIIEELKKYPDIKLGHIYVLNKHEYRLGIPELEELQKRINKAEKEDSGIYDVSGKRKISAYDITILNILDPYLKYEKYEKFYNELYDQIDTSIDSIESGVVMASSEDIIKEARKIGLAIEKDDDLLDGITLYFGRREIESRRIVKDKEGVRKEYVVFGRSGTIVRQEPIHKLPKITSTGVLDLSLERDQEYVKELKEKTKEFEPFYSDLEQTVLAFIKQSKEGNAAVNIDNIMTEGKKTNKNVDSKKNIFLQGLVQYFNEKNIATEILKKDNFMVFKMV